MRGKKEGAGQGWRGGYPSTAGAIPECLGHGIDVPSRKRKGILLSSESFISLLIQQKLRKKDILLNT